LREGRGWEALEERSGLRNKGAASIGGDDFVQSLASCFGSIFLNLDSGEADGGTRSKGVGGLSGHDAEVESLGGGSVSSGGELIGLSEACGGS